jgi:hypothetical protein
VIDQFGARTGFPRGQRARRWLGTCALAIPAVLAAGCAGSQGSTTGTPAANPNPTPSPTSVPSSALGPAACEVTGQAGGTGPWKVTAPRTLCGEPMDLTASDKQSNQALLKVSALLFAPGLYPGAGQAKSGFAVGYESPNGLGIYRNFTVLAFNGNFPNPVLTMTDQAGDDSLTTFHRVPPGPHGGVMECGKDEGEVDCVFATSTTLADFSFGDTSGQLTGARRDAVALEIRDAVEIRG